MFDNLENIEKDIAEIENFIFHIEHLARKVIIEEGMNNYRNDRVTRIRKNDIWFQLCMMMKTAMR